MVLAGDREILRVYRIAVGRVSFPGVEDRAGVVARVVLVELHERHAGGVLLQVCGGPSVLRATDHCAPGERREHQRHGQSSHTRHHRRPGPCA